MFFIAPIHPALESRTTTNTSHKQFRTLPPGSDEDSDTVPAIAEPHTTNPASAALCETCGYELDDVLRSSPDAPCPECGLPARASSPANRPGTPWQQQRSPTSLWLSIWQTIARPAKMFRRMEASPRHAASLLIIQSLVASIAFISPWSGVFIADPVRQLRLSRTLTHSARIISVVVIEVLVLAALIAMGSLAIGLALRFYARARSMRPARGTIISIIANAAIGWTVIAGIVWSLLTAWFIATLIIAQMASPDASRALGDASGWIAQNAGRIGIAPAMLVVFGAGAALVTRISLTGLYECRFANPPQTADAFASKVDPPSNSSGPMT